MKWRLALGLLLSWSMLSQAQTLSVISAGSLKDALSEVAAHHQQRTGVGVSLTFGPSGLLRQRLEQAAADPLAQGVALFISADMDHPRKLNQAGGWQPVQVLVQNRLCVLANPEVQGRDVLALLLDERTRVGMSTPKADPAGDYAWAMFGKAESLQTGATQRLRDKALQLTGGPQSAQAPSGRNPYAWVMSQGQVDVFVTYCTNAKAALQDTPSLHILPVPQALQVSASYGMTLRTGASVEAQQFAQSLLQSQAQAVFAKYGFSSAP